MSRSFAGFVQLSKRVTSQARGSVLSAAVFAIVLAVPAVSSYAANNTLQQGIDTIRQILAKDGRYSRITTSARKDYKSDTEKTFSVSAADGCKLTVQSESSIHTELPTQNRVIDRQSIDVFRSNFSQLDPATIEVGDPQPPQPTWQMSGYLVRVSVEAGKPFIIASTIDKATNATHDLPGVPTLAVYVSSREAADRLAAAFKQVTTACRAGASGK